jgi:hypothetical protein
MYHVFQQENEMSAVLFNETCETEQELNELIENPTLPIMFVYDSYTGYYSHSNGHYTPDQCVHIVNSHLNL